MSSSISTSDPAAWRRALWRYGVVCAALGPTLAALVVVVDPYDTGRFTPFDRPGVAEFGQRMTAASLGRDPGANGSIIGNSTIQPIRPDRLDAGSGLHFVSLTVPGSGPIEQSVIADWFLRHHPAGRKDEAKALIFGLDRSWCLSDTELELTHPFPFWLYGRSALTYLFSLLRFGSLQATVSRVGIILGIKTPFRRDGYRNYDNGQDRDPIAAARDFALGYRQLGPHGRIEFAAIPRLRGLLREAPGATAIVIVFLPRHYSSLPPPGSEEARVENSCKQAIRDLAAERDRTIVVDLAVDGDLARDDVNFFDQVHYRNPIAHVVENAIAAALLRLANRK